MGDLAAAAPGTLSCFSKLKYFLHLQTPLPLSTNPDSYDINVNNRELSYIGRAATNTYFVRSEQLKFYLIEFFFFPSEKHESAEGIFQTGMERISTTRHKYYNLH